MVDDIKTVSIEDDYVSRSLRVHMFPVEQKDNIAIHLSPGDKPQWLDHERFLYNPTSLGNYGEIKEQR